MLDFIVTNGSISKRSYFLSRLATLMIPFYLQGEDHFGESVQESSNDPEKDVINITLSRPLVFVQPVAVDRAILFWLSYKNAYEYWTDQRLKLNNEVLEATDQVLEKLPISQITSQLSSQHVGTLFLQLNVKVCNIRNNNEYRWTLFRSCGRGQLSQFSYLYVCFLGYRCMSTFSIRGNMS